MLHIYCPEKVRINATNILPRARGARARRPRRIGRRRAITRAAASSATAGALRRT
eukprot:COSAG06_NODE_1128_length_10601_cov_13.337460_4_plen_55_part_00